MGIENIDFVKCQICGKIAGVINHLHLRTHNIDTIEYLRQYPGAVLSASKIVEERNKKLKGQKRTDETKKRLSIKNKISWQKNPHQGRTGSPLGEESKKALSEKLKGHVVSDETRRKIGEAGIGREPWNKDLTKADDIRLQSVSKKISEWNTISMTPEKRKQIGQTLKKLYANGMKIPNAKVGFRKDLGMSFRSRWEANYARILKYQNKEIIYEIDRYPLLDDKKEIICVYVPDFKMGDNSYVEIKGHADSEDSWTCNCKRCERDKKKKELLSQQYPNVKVQFIGKQEYKKLCRDFESIIPNWEHSDSKLSFNKKRRKIVTTTRVAVNLFEKPDCYFRDCTTIDLKELLEVGDMIRDSLRTAFDVANLLLKDGWKYVYNYDEIEFSHKEWTAKDMEGVKKHLKEIGVDIDLLNIDKIEDFEK